MRGGDQTGSVAVWLCAVLAVLLFCAGTAHALTAEENAQNKIKLADRQRLLSEQIGRSVCLVMGQIDAGAESDKARGSADLFDTTMHALREGDENMGLLAEQNPEILQALDEVAAIAATYRAATLQVGAGDLHSVPVSQVMQLSAPLLERSNALIDVIETTYGRAGNRKLTQTVELARRQTMLTQKLAKEICFVSLNIDRATMIDRLSKTVDDFQSAQNALESGETGAGILRPPPALAKKLADVRVLWDEFAHLANGVIAGQDLDRDEFGAMVDLSNKILFKCKQVARAYQNL